MLALPVSHITTVHMGPGLRNRQNANHDTYPYLANVSLSSTAQYVELQAQHTEAMKTVHEQKQLVSQLEKDLLSVNALSSMYRGEGEVRITHVCFI